MGLIAYIVCAIIAYITFVHIGIEHHSKEFPSIGVDGVDVAFIMFFAFFLAAVWPIPLATRLFYLKLIKPGLDRKGIKVH